MKIEFRHWARLGAAKMTCCVFALGFHNAAMGADIPTDSLKIAAGVVKAPSYETVPAKGYIVANSTNISAIMSSTEPTSPGSLSLEKRSRPSPK
jgi:hypothetical protein